MWNILVPGFLASMSLILFVLVWKNRTAHQIQVRSSFLMLCFAANDFVGIFGVFLRQALETKMSCQAVSWYGLYAINTLGTLGILQGWYVVVKSDRGMRQRFQFTTVPKFQTGIICINFLYNAIMLVIFEHFKHSQSQRDGNCYFLLPWQIHLPFFILVVGTRVFMNRLTKQNAIEEKIIDDLGVCIESAAVDVGEVTLVTLHMAFAQSCSAHKIARGCFLSDYSYMLCFCSHALIGLAAPVFKVFNGDKISRISLKYRRPRKFKIVCTDRKSSKHLQLSKRGFSLADVLKDEKDAKELRALARRKLCAENVDFLMEVEKYETIGEKINNQPQDILACTDNPLVIQLHTKYLDIVNEFVVNNAPSEVNLSSSQKADLVKFKDSRIFCSQLSKEEMLHVFKNSKAEIGKLIKENILPSFLSSSSL